ncbi:MAG: SHOCT domain-containing protein [Armatimonadota bacterium]|nr:SHOCT domain-containing protein [Armatimonadota bacterium]
MSWRDAVLVAVVVLGVLVLLPALWMGVGGWGWMMGPGMMGRWGGWGWGWGGLLGSLVLLLLVAGVALVVVGLTRRERSDSALEILRERLARGEITAEQYEELRKLLQ